MDRGDIERIKHIKRCCEDIAAAINRFSATRAQMPWGLMKGMGNLFAHTYATMDKSDVWETAAADIPNLLRFCENILEQNK